MSRRDHRRARGADRAAPTVESFELEARASSVRTARQHARRYFERLGPDCLDDVELLVSELVTNAVRHGIGPVGVRMECRRGSLTVRVQDHDRRVPELGTPEEFSPGGRGLRIVDQLATLWGTDLTEDGKAVWFTLRCPEHREEGP